MALHDHAAFDPTPAELSHKKDDFGHFLIATLFFTTHALQIVALLTIAFAIGAGWWAGMAAMIAIGLVIGLAFRQGAGYWAFQIAEWILLALGGLAAALMHLG